MPGSDPRVPRWLDASAAHAWRALVVGGAVAALYLLLARLALVVVPLLLAVLIAGLLVPPARWLERRRWPRGLAAAVVIVVALAALSALSVLLAQTVATELAALQGLLRDGGQPIADRLGMALRVAPAARDRALAALQQLGEGAGPDVEGVLSAVTAAGQVTTGAVLTVVFAAIFVGDGPRIAASLRDVLPAPRRRLAEALGQRAWGAVSGYVRGLSLVALLDALGIGAGLLVIGVPLAAALSAIVFLSCFVPLVGPTVAGLLAVLVAFVGAGPVQALWTLALVLVVQQIAANVLQPLILGRSIDLHPLLVIVALTTGSLLAGLPGLFLAVPVAGVLAAVTDELRHRPEVSTTPEPDPAHQ